MQSLADKFSLCGFDVIEFALQFGDINELILINIYYCLVHISSEANRS